jgi:hypothetical protein
MIVAGRVSPVKEICRIVRSPRSRVPGGNGRACESLLIGVQSFRIVTGQLRHEDERIGQG